jgi:hypothetical protein
VIGWYCIDYRDLALVEIGLFSDEVVDATGASGAKAYFTDTTVLHGQKKSLNSKQADWPVKNRAEQKVTLPCQLPYYDYLRYLRARRTNSWSFNKHKPSTVNVLHTVTLRRHWHSRPLPSQRSFLRRPHSAPLHIRLNQRWVSCTLLLLPVLPETYPAPR